MRTVGAALAEAPPVWPPAAAAESPAAIPTRSIASSTSAIATAATKGRSVRRRSEAVVIGGNYVATAAQVQLKDRRPRADPGNNGSMGG
jgi:hypothetical protein